MEGVLCRFSICISIIICIQLFEELLYLSILNLLSTETNNQFI